MYKFYALIGTERIKVEYVRFLFIFSKRITVKYLDVEMRKFHSEADLVSWVKHYVFGAASRYTLLDVGTLGPTYPSNIQELVNLVNN